MWAPNDLNKFSLIWILQIFPFPGLERGRNKTAMQNIPLFSFMHFNAPNNLSAESASVASVFVFPHAVYPLLYLDSILCCPPVTTLDAVRLVDVIVPPPVSDWGGNILGFLDKFWRTRQLSKICIFRDHPIFTKKSNLRRYFFVWKFSRVFLSWNSNNNTIIPSRA